METLTKYGQVSIESVEGEPMPIYKIAIPKGVKAPVLTKADLSASKSIPDAQARWIKLKEIAKKKGAKSDFAAAQAAGKLLGYGVLSPLIDDDNLEEIMVNGAGENVFVYHRKFGMCKTFIQFVSADGIKRIAKDVCEASGKKDTTITDLAAVDGSRVNITDGDIPSRGAVMTIRKQRRKSFSIIELMENGTVSLDLASFLWLAVEGMNLTPGNILIAGSVGSGKTTMLNALSSFIPPKERVITIEDTFELSLLNIENKVQLESNKEFDMDALLRDTLRMRPDRIIVGEIRGKEAMTLFNAMKIGRIGMGTLHASSSREVADRLESEPMSVPPHIIGTLDLVLVQNRFVNKGKIVRRITQVSEVSGETKGTVMMGDIFLWDPTTDDVARVKEGKIEVPILFLDKLSESTRIDKRDIMKELEMRRMVLYYMLKTGIKSLEDVSDLIERFYIEKEGLFESIPELGQIKETIENPQEQLKK